MSAILDLAAYRSDRASGATALRAAANTESVSYWAANSKETDPSYVSEPLNVTANPTRQKMSDISREEMKSEIALAEARTDTRIVKLEGVINTALATITGKIDALSVQVADQRRDKNFIIGTIVLATLALGGLFWGAVTYGDAIFGRGMNVRDVVQTVIKEQQAQQPQSPKSNAH
jgi:hypothetical protein